MHVFSRRFCPLRANSFQLQYALALKETPKDERTTKRPHLVAWLDLVRLLAARSTDASKQTFAKYFADIETLHGHDACYWAKLDEEVGMCKLEKSYWESKTSSKGGKYGKRGKSCKSGKPTELKKWKLKITLTNGTTAQEMWKDVGRRTLVMLCAAVGKKQPDPAAVKKEVLALAGISGLRAKT